MTHDNEDIEPLIAETIDTIGNFYRGIVCKLHRSPERGKVRTASGREIPFMFAHLTMAGSRRRFDHLREGMEIGYDLGWTSKGVRVHLIWIPEEGPRPGLEGQGGSEEDEPAQHLANKDGENGDVE